MEDYKTRLLKEISDLSEKIDKLANFIESSRANVVNSEHLVLLTIQLSVMKTYLLILDKRKELLDM